MPAIASSAAKAPIEMVRNISVSVLGVGGARVWLAQWTGLVALMSAGACRGLFCVDQAHCETRRPRLEPFLAAGPSVGRNQSRLIQLRQSLVEASDTRVVEVSRLPESHHDSTGMLLLRHA